MMGPAVLLCCALAMAVDWPRSTHNLHLNSGKVLWTIGLGVVVLVAPEHIIALPFSTMVVWLHDSLPSGQARSFSIPKERARTSGCIVIGAGCPSQPLEVEERLTVRFIDLCRVVAATFDHGLGNNGTSTVALDF
jgi:hypothetical protein